MEFNCVEEDIFGNKSSTVHTSAGCSKVFGPRRKIFEVTTTHSPLCPHADLFKDSTSDSFLNSLSPEFSNPSKGQSRRERRSVKEVSDLSLDKCSTFEYRGKRCHFEIIRGNQGRTKRGKLSDDFNPI